MRHPTVSRSSSQKQTKYMQAILIQSYNNQIYYHNQSIRNLTFTKRSKKFQNFRFIKTRDNIQQAIFQYILGQYSNQKIRALST